MGVLMMSSVISTGAMGILMAEKNDRLEQDGDKDYTAPSPVTEGGIKARAHTQTYIDTHRQTYIDIHTYIVTHTQTYIDTRTDPLGSNCGCV